MTFTPACDSAVAMPNPMPDAAPVTNAVLPDRSFMDVSLRFYMARAAIVSLGRLLGNGSSPGGQSLPATNSCRVSGTSDKTQIEHNKIVFDLIADMPRDIDFCCNGPEAAIP
jgi:hypothetical protein